MPQKEKKKLVYLLHHTNPKNHAEKFIGVYSTRKNAQEAVLLLRKQPGFKESPRKFKIARHELDRTWWTEGFISWKEALDALDEEPSTPRQKKVKR